MARLVSSVIFIVFFSHMAFSADSAAGEPLPYTEDEFNPVLKDVRRAEIIAFGSFPFVVFFSTIYYDVYRYFSHDMREEYLPWPFKDASTAVAVSEDEQKRLLLVSAGISVGIAAIDFVVRGVLRHMREKRAAGETEDSHPIQIRPLVRSNDGSPYPQPSVPDADGGIQEDAPRDSSGGGGGAR